MYLRISARLKLPSHSNHSKSYHVDPYLMCTLISHPYTNNVYSDWSSTRTNQILPLESISNQPRANNSPLTKSFSPDVTDRGFRFQRATKTWIRKRQPFKSPMRNDPPWEQNDTRNFQANFISYTTQSFPRKISLLVELALTTSSYSCPPS